jgi:hypothetical protein
MSNYYEVPYKGVRYGYVAVDDCDDVPPCVDKNRMVMRCALQFPREWIESYLPETGLECSNCMHYCCWNGVFVAYCGGCARQYEYQRGYGFCGDTMVIGENAPLDAPTSAGNTYLKNVLYDDIGDALLIGGLKDSGNFFPTVQRNIDLPIDYCTLYTFLKHPDVIKRWQDFNCTMAEFKKLTDGKPCPMIQWLEWFKKDLCDFSEQKSSLWEDVQIEEWVTKLKKVRFV